MKIIVTSDLHYPTTPKHAIMDLIRDIKNENPHFVVLAGDIGENVVSPYMFYDCLCFFAQRLDCLVGVIAGNHDLWAHQLSNGRIAINSLELWKRYLKSMTENAGAIWLESNNIDFQDTTVVASMLHYDFSAIDKDGSASFGKEYFIKHKSEIVNDGKYFVGLPGDVDFAKTIGDSFMERLLSAQNNPDVKEIIVVTHVPCLEPQITRKPWDFQWSVGTPFFGNLSHQDLILSCDKITNVISGHSHQGIDIKFAGKRVAVVGSDYGSPKYITINTG